MSQEVQHHVALGIPGMKGSRKWSRDGIANQKNIEQWSAIYLSKVLFRW